MAELTEKQKIFVKEYMVDLNATQAAIRAGYSKKTAKVIGHENLTKPYIQEYLQDQMDKRAKKVELTAESVLQSIVEVRNRCMQVEPVMEKVDGEYIESGIFKFDATNALKANEMLGKHLKLFTDKVELEVKEIPKIILKRGK